MVSLEKYLNKAFTFCLKKCFSFLFWWNELEISLISPPLPPLPPLSPPTPPTHPPSAPYPEPYNYYVAEGENGPPTDALWKCESVTASTCLTDLPERFSLSPMYGQHDSFGGWQFIERKWFWTVGVGKWLWTERCVSTARADWLIRVCHSNLADSIIS